MKKVITILISCSLALAASVIAQQDEQQQKPKKEKAQPERSHPANEARQAPQPQSVPRQPRQRAETKAPGHETAPQSSEQSATTLGPRGRNPARTVTKAPEKEPGHANAGEQQIEQRKKERGAPNEPDANKPPGPAPATEREQSNVAPASQAKNPNPQENKLNAKAKKPDPQTVQKIKTEHTNFHAQAKPDKVPAVTFNQGHRISGSEHWQGSQYEVYRSYHPERHDQGWYRSHYNRVELIGGGYYYWNNGYWFPAWGYDPSAEYYAYDAPIYVGSSAEPPDRVIADVQATLQEMGYYHGEVDGLLGPLTREALAAYQADNGLTTTEVIDEPTLSSLGMS
ncbi:MAG TPA: peptidoglycan-binding protein [Candidatus Udaeobacter sp.]